MDSGSVGAPLCGRSIRGDVSGVAKVGGTASVGRCGGGWGLCGGWCSQGLVALSGLRTLGFGKDRPAGARAAVGGLRWLGLCGGWGVCGGWACTVVGVPRVWSPFQGCAPWALGRVAPIGACVAVGACVVVGGCAVVEGCAAVGGCVAVGGGAAVGFPRVWSPFQGCAPWALGRVAPIGACAVVGGGVVVGGVRWLGLCGGWCSQGLVALSGLRTLGFGEGRPYRGLRGHPRSVLILVSPWRGINPSSCQQAELSAPRQRYVVRQRVRGLLL